MSGFAGCNRKPQSLYCISNPMISKLCGRVCRSDFEELSAREGRDDEDRAL
jgi:hypothetical protein